MSPRHETALVYMKLLNVLTAWAIFVALAMLSLEPA